MEKSITEIEEEFDTLIQAAYDELAVGDNEIAEEYLADAGSLIYDLPAEARDRLATKYSINPLNFC